MGGSKRMMEQREDDLSWARSFLIEIGTLESCEFHGDTFDGDGDMERAYQILNARVTSGAIPLASGQTRRDLTDLLKDAYEDSSGPDSCPSCDHNMRD